MVEKNTKIRVNTMIEKRGFRDDDLYKIDHDKICSWLYDNCDAWLKKRFIGHKVNYIPNDMVVDVMFLIKT